MTRIFALLSLVVLLGCAAEGPRSGVPLDFEANSGLLSGNYDGADAGYLIMSLAAAHSHIAYNSYTIRFRKTDRSVAGGVWWGQHNISDQRKLDIKDRNETGIIDVRRLPPGDYEIFNYNIYFNSPYVQNSWWSKQDFAIPFTIASGKATYVGEFMAVAVTGKNILGISVPDGAYFVLSDKSSRDVSIARQKELRLGDVTNAVADPNAIGNPLIRARIE
jgi:hypothetical protein